MGVHSDLPFLSMYFGTKEDIMKSSDDIKSQLRSLSTRYYDQTNVLNGMKMSFQQERKNWIIEKEHMIKKIEMLKKTTNVSKTETSLEDMKISKLALQFKTLSTKVENELLIVKEEFKKTENNLNEQIDKMKLENTSLRQAVLEVINGSSCDTSSDIISDYFISSFYICEQKLEANGKPDENCSCHCCHKLVGQKKLLMKIVNSQKERLLEKNAKIKALKSIVNTPFLSEEEKSISLSKTT